MENKKSNTGLIVTIVVLVMLILFGGTLFVLSSMGYVSFGKDDVKEEIDEDVSNENETINEEENRNEEFNDSANFDVQSQLERIIVDELYIITNRNTGRATIKSISDIESYDLETLVINKFNSSSSTLTSISKNEMQDILNDTCLSNMSITYNGTYTKNEYTKRNLYYGEIAAYKTVAFTESGDKYTLSVKYIFVDNGDSGDRGQCGYGNMDDLKNMKNPVIDIYNDYSLTTKIIDDVQKYLDENYESLKDKLVTYNYVFEKNNGKFNLVELSVN